MKHPLIEQELQQKLNYAAGLALMMAEAKVNELENMAKLMELEKTDLSLIASVAASNPEQILLSIKEDFGGRDEKYVYLFDVYLIGHKANGEGFELLAKEVAQLLSVKEEEAEWLNLLANAVSQQDLSYALRLFDRLTIYENEITDGRLFSYAMSILSVNKNELTKDTRELFDKQTAKWEKIQDLKKSISDKRILKNSQFVARTQKELEALKDEYIDERVIYLLGETFTIEDPIRYVNNLFVGINKPTVYLVGDWSYSVLTEDETYVFDCDMKDFRGVYLTAKKPTEVHYSKDENRLQNCEVDENKITLCDPSEEIADFLDDALPKLKDLGWLD